MGHSESKKLKKVQEWVTLKVKSSLEEAAGARQGWCDGYPPPIVAFYQPESLRGKALYPCACLHSVAPSGVCGGVFSLQRLHPIGLHPATGSVASSRLFGKSFRLGRWGVLNFENLAF